MSFKRARGQKTHRERSQPSFRNELGILEKKKDYKVRANDRHRKEKALKKLKAKAQDRNPDEFTRAMIVTKFKDGAHRARKQKEINDPDQIKLIQSQDKRYVEYRRHLEAKKAERLQESLHHISEGQRNTHTFFVDGKQEVREFDLAKHLNTHPSLLDRAYNRPTLEQLASLDLQTSIPDPRTMAEAIVAKEDSYRELEQRLKREKELLIVQQKLELKTQLMDKGRKKKLILPETKSRAAVYQWQAKRKR